MKYFLVSDIHSFYRELKTALKEKGYDKSNPEHTLVILGDCFDRGPESKQLLRFLRSIPEDRLILIKGNHEYLLLDLLEKYYPSRHDFSNGTVRTCCNIAGVAEYSVRIGTFDVDTLDTKLYPEQVWEVVKNKCKRSTLYKFLTKRKWHHYYEIGNYILVHSFFPLKSNDDLPPWYVNGRDFEYNPDWRNTTVEYEWEDATWGCPYKLVQSGLFDEEFKNGKTLICGHWSSSDFHRVFNNDDTDNNDIFISDKIIALDATTAASNKINVFVIEE